MGGGQFLDFRFGQFPRRGIVAERNGGRPNGLPSSFVRRHGLAAKRTRVLRAFAAGMAQLNPELRGAISFAAIDNPLERCLVLVRAQGGATGGNPAIHGDVGHLDRKSTRLHSIPSCAARMPSSAWKKKKLN